MKGEEGRRGGRDEEEIWEEKEMGGKGGWNREGNRGEIEMLKFCSNNFLCTVE